MKEFFVNLYNDALTFLEANWFIVSIVAAGLLLVSLVFLIGWASCGRKLRKNKRAAAWNERSRTQVEENDEVAQLRTAMEGFKQENENLAHERKVFFEKQKQYQEKIAELETSIDSVKDENEKLKMRTTEAEANLEMSERQKEAMVSAAKAAESTRIATESERALLLEENCNLKAEIDRLQAGGASPKAAKPKTTASTTAKKTTTAKPKAASETAAAKAPAKKETAPKPKAVSEDEEEESVGSGSVKYTVKFDRPKNSWVIIKAGAERATRRVDTKEEAMKVARELAKKDDVVLSVHKKNGQFQKQ